MRIGGLVKLSVVDWPGTPAAVVFTKGCNFRCSYCRNPLLVFPDLLDRTPDIPSDIVLNYLHLCSSFIEGVVIAGGEPTIQHKLPDFLYSVKDMGLKVKLDTNGTNPAMLKKLIESELVDYIAMDIKAGFTDEQYENITGVSVEGLMGDILQSVQIIRSSGLFHHFYTTVLPSVHTPEIIEELEITTVRQ